MTDLQSISRRGLFGMAAAFGVLKAIPLDKIMLGVTSDEIDEEPAKAAEFLARFDVRWVEVRSIWGKYNTAQPMDKVREAKAAFAAKKVGISIVDTAFFRGTIPAGGEALEKEWTLLNDSMDRADVFGTKVLRTFAFMPAKGLPGSLPLPERATELLNEAAARAAKRGFRLAVENLKGSYVQVGADAARLLQAVKAPNFGLTWDPNNAASAGEKSFPDGFGMLDASRIFHVHLRDFKHKADGEVEWVAVGAGEFDNLGQINALRKAGFRGSLTLETHWRAPEGKAFSTETSLKALLKVIEKVSG